MMNVDKILEVRDRPVGAQFIAPTTGLYPHVGAMNCAPTGRSPSLDDFVKPHHAAATPATCQPSLGAKK